MDSSPDPRNITNGLEIPTITYSDQPYIVQTDDGAWLCCVTTGAGREGEPGQIVTTLRSTDQGRTWSAPVAVEPADGPEASYACLLKAPSGRIFIFYNHNTDNVRAVQADNPPYATGWCTRVDSLGHFVFKCSDDDGRTWSPQRYAIPVREFAIDRANADRGRLCYFWNVGKPFIHHGTAYVSLHKVGGFGDGFFTSSEGVLLCSRNLLHEPDPERITWETLPDGDIGLRTPPGGGPVAEEQSYSVLSDGSFFCVYRTIDGHPACCYSRDRGRTWSTPRYMGYADGRLMKHPRAANFAWKCANGKYLYWFHNHGGRFIREHPRRRTIAYEDRNPVWLCGGIEVDSPEGRIIHWSQPEIVLYDDDPYVRMSYPDLVEEGGRTFLTETQKNRARVHEIDPQLLAGLWGQLTGESCAPAGASLVLDAGSGPLPSPVELPALPPFLARDASRPDYGTRDHRAGLTLELWAQCNSAVPGQVLLDNRSAESIGFCLQTAPGNAIELVLNDGRTESRWTSDPGSLVVGRRQHIVAIVDGGPKLILFVIDGVLNDGGDARQFGWGRYNPQLRGASRFTHPGPAAPGETLHIGPSLQGAVTGLRWYARALRVSEAIAGFRHGPAARQARP